MSIADYTLDEGVVVIGQGDGWSIWSEPATGRCRVDVFADGTARAVPLGAVSRGALQAATEALAHDAKTYAGLAAPVAGLTAFVAGFAA